MLVAPSEETRASFKPIEVRELPKLMSSYPNPASDYFYISYVLPLELESAYIELYDMRGNRVNSVDVSAGIGLEYFTSKDLSAGTYLAVFKVDGEKVTEEKITVIK